MCANSGMVAHRHGHPPTIHQGHTESTGYPVKTLLAAFRPGTRPPIQLVTILGDPGRTHHPTQRTTPSVSTRQVRQSLRHCTILVSVPTAQAQQPITATVALTEWGGVALSVKNVGAMVFQRMGMLIEYNMWAENLWTTNAAQWRCEERIGFAVPRPTAVNVVTNLPY